MEVDDDEEENPFAEQQVSSSTSRQKTKELVMELNDILDISAMEYEVEHEQLEQPIEQKQKMHPYKTIEQRTDYNIAGDPEYTYTQYTSDIESLREHARMHTMPQLSVPPPTKLPPELWWLVVEKLESDKDPKSLTAFEQTSRQMLFPTKKRRLKEFLRRMLYARTSFKMSDLPYWKALAVRSYLEVHIAAKRGFPGAYTTWLEVHLLVETLSCTLRYLEQDFRAPYTLSFRTFLQVFEPHSRKLKLYVIGDASIAFAIEKDIVDVQMAEYTTHLSENERQAVVAAVEQRLWQFLKEALPEFY